MKRLSRLERLTSMEIMGQHIQKHRILMIVVLSIISAIALAFTIFWNYDENSFGQVLDYVYLYSYIALLVISLAILVCLIINKNGKISILHLGIILHSYSLLIMAWGTTMCVIDMTNGFGPFVYLLVFTMVSGLFVVDPYFFSSISLTSFTIVIIFHIVNKFAYFSGNYMLENVLNFVIYTILVLLIAFRHYNVTIREYKAYKKIEEMNYRDELTGLLNERSYLNEIDFINEHLEQKDFDYAVILMDVNNLKVTNDAYGHRFGCHLIVHCGHTLPKIFKTSKLFHVGGDEFIAIIYGEDLAHFDERIKTFDEMCRFTKHEYEGIELIFSVARGYAKHQEGMKYKDVLQIADKAMYENKAEIKSTYNLKSGR